MEQTAKPALTIKGLFNDDKVKNRFNEMLGKKAPGFITSVLQLVSTSKDLSSVDPISIYNAAAIAATLDLPINNSLGFAWIVPYQGKAQFQIGAKGYVQLALRTAQYAKMNVIEIHQSRFISFNKLTEDLNVDFSKPAEGPIVGYCAYFRLINGFEKTVYWTLEEVIDHAKKYSKSFNNPKSGWKTDFEKMAKKTVLKNTVAPWGILSVEMQMAVQVDQAVINDADTIDVSYVDSTDEDNLTPDEKAAKATQATMDELKKQAEKK